MTRMLSFSPDVFFSLFADYNLAIWPAQPIAYALGLLVVALTFKPTEWSGRLIAAVLALAWLWIGIAYHYLYFTQINFVAPAFAALFVLQGLLFAWSGVVRGRLTFAFRPDLFGWTGLGFLIFALAVYPLLGWLAGHVWPQAPVFGVAPCPTAIFTWGLLLMIGGHTPLHLVVLPLIWSLIGASAAWLLAVPEDLSLLAAGLVGAVLVIYKNRRSAQATAAAAGTRRT
jgi:hypothetical protein